VPAPITKNSTAGRIGPGLKSLRPNAKNGAAEEHEQKHLHGRLAAYALTPESADCARMNHLKTLRAELLTPEEKEELKTLEARHPDVPLDRTRDAPLAEEAVRMVLRARRS
jgi:hypothetical protein